MMTSKNSRTLAEGWIEAEDVLSTVLDGALCRSLAVFDFALQTGDERHFTAAIEILTRAPRLVDDVIS